MDYTCDSCGAEFVHGEESYELIEWINREPYCPNCGHRLSGY